MLIKTDSVKERGNSIGMFSRHGKATALIHSMFRDEKVIKSTKKKIEDEYLAQMISNKAAPTKKKENELRRSADGPRESYFFRYLSREKAQPVKDKTPDSGIYKPKFTVVEPNTVFMAKYVKEDKPENKRHEHEPQCLAGGVNCEFQVRNLKKKIAVVKKEIAASNVDPTVLYNER
jgi:hypothetical protein